ncbi:MAG: flagellar hook-associated protein FlgK [Acidimicrobiia bacterium]
MSDFAALNTAVSGLYAYRRQSEVIANNIANVNTEGYSRQRVDLATAGGGAVPGVFSKPSGVGTGVQIDDITRIRDDFMEKRALSEQAASGSLKRQKEILARVELTFPEPGPNGLAQQMAEYWSSFDDVANDPASEGARSQLLERANTVVEGFHRSAQDLTDLRHTSIDQLSAITQEVNGYSARIAELNSSIRTATAGGITPNDLMDQRDLLINKITNLVGVSTRTNDDGTVDVMASGGALVRGDRSNEIAVATNVQPPGQALTDVNLQKVGLIWTKDGGPVVPSGGEAHGIIQSVNEVIPKYLNSLNNAARAFAETNNAAHHTGYDRFGAAGGDLFGYSPGTAPTSPAAPTDFASRLTVAITDPKKIAASSDPTALLDGSKAKDMAKLGALTTGADAIYKAMIGQLGVDGQTVNRRSQIQDNVTNQVDNARKSVSGVNLDEEMTNLVAAQHAYTASAKMISTIDEMIQTILGLVR